MFVLRLRRFICLSVVVALACGHVNNIYFPRKSGRVVIFNMKRQQEQVGPYYHELACCVYNTCNVANTATNGIKSCFIISYNNVCFCAVRLVPSNTRHYVCFVIFYNTHVCAARSVPGLLYLAEVPQHHHLTLTLLLNTLTGPVAKVLHSIIHFFSSSASTGSTEGPPL